MWQRLAGFVLRFRLLLLFLLLGSTALMGYYASKVQLSYEFGGAIPTDNPRYLEYMQFRQQFGEDGNLLVVAVQDPQFFAPARFDAYRKLTKALKQVPGVENILSVAGAVNLVKNDSTHKLLPVAVFPEGQTGAQLDSAVALFHQLPFYTGQLYNPQASSYLMAVRINKDVMSSARRNVVVKQITTMATAFGKQQQEEVYMSGLPLIRTAMATRVADELKFFLLLSFLLTAAILFAFFRSVSAVLMSMVVVAMGVIWSVATIVLFHYKITLLTSIIPPLIVVIGIPNCVYFLNKYHTEYAKTGDKETAIVRMIARMGIVTLFTNITAAIGFGVFYFTKSTLLKQFGVVAGLNILWIFVISFIFLPVVLSLLPPPKTKHTTYLESRFFNGVLAAISKLVFRYRKIVYAITLVTLILAAVGMGRLQSVGFIVDDIPHTDKLYTDLKFFERNFKGVMPLEIAIDTKKKNGVISLPTLQKIDSLSAQVAALPEFARPLSIAEGIKFVKQAYYNGDTASYSIPNQFDVPFLAPYLRMKNAGSEAGGSGSAMFSKLLASFMDSSRRVARVSVSMADVGSQRLPLILDSLRPAVNQLFDTAQYKVTFTGTSIIFLEGSRFIIHGLVDSIMLAFVLIIFCMLYLFRSWRMLLIALVPNLIPLVVTAGVMGWCGIAIKPSTVLVFSIALGIAIDVTIRFLVNFKQELPHHQGSIGDTVQQTIRETGLSIIYTSLILFAGFMIFSFSDFGGTRALGWLTSLTLVLAMVTNLTILPSFLLWLERSKNGKAANGKM